MIEEGIVIKTDGEEAVVLVERKSACERCHSKGFCQMTESDKLEVHARNEIGAKPNQIVELSIPDSAGLAASALVYLIPTVLFIAGIILGLAAFKTHFAGAFGGLVGLALGFSFAAIIWNRNWRRKGLPKVVSIKD